MCTGGGQKTAAHVLSPSPVCEAGSLAYLRIDDSLASGASLACTFLLVPKRMLAYRCAHEHILLFVFWGSNSGSHASRRKRVTR